MSVFDPHDGLSEAQIQRALGSLSRVRGGAVPRSGPGRPKIKTRPTSGKVHPLEVNNGGNLNTTIEVTVRVPAYLVAGALSAGDGDMDRFTREALKEKLVRAGQTWWQPRFMSVLKAKELKARARLSKNIG